MTDEHGQQEISIATSTSRSLAPRSGGIGARLPGNAMRKTARRGVTPVALPYAWIRTPEAPSLIEDIVRRLELGVHPHELLVTWEIHDPHLARRHWPDYWVRIEGIDLDSITDPVVVGPIFSLPSNPGFPTHGRAVLLLRAEVRWRDSPAYGLFRYRRGWPEVKITIEDIEHARTRYDVQMAEQGIALAQGLAPLGRTPTGRPQELDRLAHLGLKWTQVPGTGRGPEDLTWPIIAMADGDTQGPKKLQAQASKLAIGIDDIRQRTGELTRWGMP